MCGGGGNFFSNIGSDVKQAIQNPKQTIEGLLAGGIVGGPLGTAAGGLQGAGFNMGLGNLDPLSPPTVPNVYAPSVQGDLSAIQNAQGPLGQNQNQLYQQLQNLLSQQQGQTQGIVNQVPQSIQNAYGAAGTQAQNTTNQTVADVGANQQQQQGQLQNLLKQQMGQTVQNLTGGEQGKQLQNYYNNLGLLNSGAFNSGLAAQFAPIEQQSQNALLQQGIANQGQLGNIMESGAQQQYGLQGQQANALGNAATGGANTMANLAGQQAQTLGGVDQNTTNLLNTLVGGGLQRQFGLEDTQSNIDLQRMLAELTGKQNTQQAIVGSGSDILSSLIPVLGKK